MTDNPVSADQKGSHHDQWLYPAKTALVVLIIVQILMLGFLCGFNYDNAHFAGGGLPFGYAISFTCVYLIALFAGIVIAVINRRWRSVVAQALPLVFVLATGAVMSAIYPVRPTVDVAKYQHLVGKTRQEAETVLSARGIRHTGHGRDHRGDHVCYGANLDLRFETVQGRAEPGADERVIAVESSP